MKRTIFRITPLKPSLAPGLPWRVSWGPLRAGKKHHFWTQAAAIEYATVAARLTQGAGELAQVVLHGRDGRIRGERTYGADPKRSKG